MASFDGTDLGPFVEMQTAAAPVELQLNAYPGVNGLEALQMGSRGGTTVAFGASFASDLAGLAAVEQQFRTLQLDATVGDLVDTTGSTWTDVILRSFRPVGRISFVPGYGWGREYEMEFLHLL